MFDILTILPGSKRPTPSGWHTFNAICCHHRGQSIDIRKRGGVKFEGDNWRYHCFNCGFHCNFERGKIIDDKTRQLLQWSGIDDKDISRWSIESLRYRHVLDLIKPVEQNPIYFPEIAPPVNAEIIDDSPRFAKYVDYLRNRAIDPFSYPYMATPDEKGRNSDRIIVPYTYKDNIVGHTSRYFDNRSPKYINDQSPGFVFGMDLQHPEWSVCIVTEGIFDALSIDGCALMHETISNEQARLLATLNRRIIVVPDCDYTGLKIIDRAHELGYAVSLPNWGDGVKDVNDAVKRYGKLPTVLAILQSATTSKIITTVKRKHIASRI